MNENGFVPRDSPELVLPLILFSRYLTFLARRPISESNLHYRATRVAGLRSLIPILAAAPQPAIVEIAETLGTLTPANLIRIAPDMQRALRVLNEPLLPRNYLSLTQTPDAEFLSGVERVLILIGPAIGIGDEIITFSLPRALRHLLPGADITVSSSYPQVWDRVDQVDHVRHYTDLRNLVEAVRTAAFDLLIMVDFETPGLANAMCFEPSVERYLEISLGPRQAIALDKRNHRQWRMPMAEPNFMNYYDCMQAILHWMGAPRELETAGLMPPAARNGSSGGPSGSNDLKIFINPFTSKEDPSERYWAQLLCSILPNGLDRPVRILINTGPNLATRSLAFAMARKVEAHYAGRNVRVEVPHQTGKPGTTLSIADIFTFSDHADVIVTADSFPAHAAQLFRHLTVVLGKQRTEPWRSPSPNSFYLSSTDALPVVAGSIRCLLADILATSGDASLSSQSRELRQHIGALDDVFTSAVEASADSSELCERWSSLRSAQQAFLVTARSISGDYAILFGDNDYDDLLPEIGPQQEMEPEVWWHLRRRFREWKNSNLCKYVLQPASTESPGQIAAGQ